MAQEIIHGIGHLHELLAGRNYLLVCDSSLKFLPIKDAFHPQATFDDFTSNPLYEQVCLGVKLFNSSKCEAIVAIGGGSTIDVAKCIKLYCKMPDDKNYLEQEMVDSGIPLYAIPTTAGTGSESTRHAVIYYLGMKQSIAHPSIVPDYAILEPSVLKTLPLYQKKCTMLDALCQGIESWWSVNSTDESKVYSQKAVQGIAENWKEYIVDNKEEAAAKIMEAANYAGRAINITATTAAHAMSYKLTSMFKLPHGHAVALCMQEVWDFMTKNTQLCVDKRGVQYLEKIFQDIPVSCQWFKQLFKELEMTYPVSENREQDIKVLTESVNPTRLKNNPVALDLSVMKNMYGRIVK